MIVARPARRLATDPARRYPQIPIALAARPSTTLSPVLSLEATRRRPQYLPHRRDRPTSQTLHLDPHTPLNPRPLQTSTRLKCVARRAQNRQRFRGAPAAWPQQFGCPCGNQTAGFAPPPISSCWREPLRPRPKLRLTSPCTPRVHLRRAPGRTGPSVLRHTDVARLHRRADRLLVEIPTVNVWRASLLVDRGAASRT